MISTRGRYALRVLADLAGHTDANYIPLKDIAQRQEISLKYLERILPALVKNGYIEGVQGKGGGYRLSKEPKEITVGEILRLTEKDLAPVACLACDAEVCSRKDTCSTFPMWEGYNKITNEYFDGISVADLI